MNFKFDPLKFKPILGKTKKKEKQKKKNKKLSEEEIKKPITDPEDRYKKFRTKVYRLSEMRRKAYTNLAVVMHDMRAASEKGTIKERKKEFFDALDKAIDECYDALHEIEVKLLGRYDNR